MKEHQITAKAKPKPLSAHVHLPVGSDVSGIVTKKDKNERRLEAMLRSIKNNADSHSPAGYAVMELAVKFTRQKAILILLISTILFGALPRLAFADNQESDYANTILLKKRQSVPEVAGKRSISKMVQRSDLIIRGKVISTESQWKEDSRGRHIYTSVTVKIIDTIIGNIKDSTLSFEVIGGTVDNRVEMVSHTPVFEIDEDVIVFLGGYPWAVQAYAVRKILVYDDGVYWDDREITVESFLGALRSLDQDPRATISLEGKRQTPAAKAADFPIITDISFDEELAVTNKQVAITGRNFGSTQGLSKVKFFNKSKQQKIQASVLSWSNTQIICTAPANLSGGSSLVTVSTIDGTSSGYVIKAAACYITGQKWIGTSPVVDYYINENTSDCTGEGAAVQRAADTWNDVGSRFTFHYAGPHSRTSASDNWVNEIMWGTLPEDFIAVTTLYFYVGEPTDGADIVFNNYYTWSTKSEPYSYEMDVESVALHEFGHWPGLEDLEDYACRYCAMYYQLGDGEVKRILCVGDCDGICYMYPKSGCGCPCSITVTSPTGSSNWATGVPHSIEWNSSRNPGSYVKIQLYKASSLIETIISSTLDDGSHSWTPSTSLADGSDYRIKISSYTDSSCYDYSDYFTICSCSITITSPTGSSSWECGNCYYINWDSECNPSNYVKIQLYKGSLPVPIISSTSDDGSYYWCVPQDITPGCDYRIKVTSTTDSSCYDYSNYFCITCCSITVTSPESGSWYDLGKTLPIAWDSEYTSGNVKIDLYKDGSFERIITSSTSDPCSYDWLIPTDESLIGSDKYQVKVTDVSNSSCDDFSDNFGIATPPEAHDGTVTTSVDTPVTITLQATDEGCPDPPAALTYIITSLPVYGDLYDPGSDWIESVLYTLVGYGNEVEYIPDTGYEGQDIFTFDANDGGVSPGGGNSNIATITIDISDCADITIGIGASMWNYPMHTFYHDSRTQVIYLADEIGAAGIITALALDVETLPGQTMNNWTIRMKHTDISSYSTASLEATGWTVVYQSDETIDSTGWQTFDFSSTPFLYNGTDNLLVDFSHNNSLYTSNGICLASDFSEILRSAYAISDSGYGDPLDWSGTSSPTVSGSSNVPNVRLTVCGGMSTELDVDPNLWMYQNLPGQTGCGLTATVSITDDPLNNTSYTYEWEFILPDDVSLPPAPVAGCGTSDPCCTFAARGCDEPNGLSDSGQPFTVKVTVTGDDYGNTATDEEQFGIALLGDVNNDCVVKVADRSIINAFWRLGEAGPFTFRDCDLNCDGVVKVADRSIANAVWRGILGQNSVTGPCPFR